MQIKGLSIEEFAIKICDYLIRNNFEVVLSGGACVSIYTDNKYKSYDLDFVLVSSGNQKKLKELLISIGFVERGRYFIHEDTDFFLDFVSPPPSVGSEPIKEISEIRKGNCILKLLSPTDCVKDRLAAFYHWNDRQALNQAILVCKDCEVDLEEVKRWSKNEEMLVKFEKFLEELSA